MARGRDSRRATSQVLPRLPVCVCAHEAHTSVCTGVGGGGKTSHTLVCVCRSTCLRVLICTMELVLVLASQGCVRVRWQGTGKRPGRGLRSSGLTRFLPAAHAASSWQLETGHGGSKHRKFELGFLGSFGFFSCPESRLPAHHWARYSTTLYR